MTARLVVGSFAIAAGAVVLARPGDARACICSAPLTVSIPDGAVDVPTNAVLYGQSGSRPGLELRGPDGTVDTQAVDLTESFGVSLWRITPLELLEPQTTYELVGADPSMPITVFTTGDARDDLGPTNAPLASVSIAHVELEGGGTSCGDAHVEVALDVEPSDDVVAYEVQIAGPGVEASYVLLRDSLDLLTGPNSSCNLALDYVRGASYCVTVRALDAAGNPGPASAACTEVRACAPVSTVPADLGSCELERGCSAGGPPGPGALVALAALLAAGRRRRAT